MQRILEIRGELVQSRYVPGTMPLAEQIRRQKLHTEHDALVFGLLGEFMREFAAAQRVTVYEACGTKNVYKTMESRFGFDAEVHVASYIDQVFQARRKVEALAGDVGIHGDVLARVFLCLV